MRLLEQRLAHSGHSLFIFADLLWDTDKHAQFWRQVDILTFLFDFKQRLVKTHNLFVILLAEVLHHGNGLALLTLFETAGFRAHVPADGRHFVCLVMTVAGHDDCVFELIVHSFVNFVLLGWFSGETLLLVGEAVHLLVNKLQAVVD